jgi:glutaminase
VAARTPLDAADYDGRRALHVAAADGSATLVALLVEAGADAAVVDRWGATPLDEAVRVGAGPVVAYLESVRAPRGQGAVRGEAVFKE